MHGLSPIEGRSEIDLLQPFPEEAVVPLPPDVPPERASMHTIDFRNLPAMSPRYVQVLQLGRAAEERTGFGANTRAFLWGPDGLSLEGLRRVVVNQMIWQHHRK